MNIICVIPARYESTRFPGKPLVCMKGKPMIQRVYDRVSRVRNVTKVIVATDSKIIYEKVKAFGGNVFMTSKKHKSGTDRVGEVAKKIRADIIVNVQGDEPLIDPKAVEKTVAPLVKDRSINVCTLGCYIKDKEEIRDPNVVKTALDSGGFAMYFSRHPIPFVRNAGRDFKYIKHIGLYAFRKSFLMKFVKMKQTPAEKMEGLEQLRILENGYKIKVVLTPYDSISVDVPADVKKVLKYF